MSFVLGFGIAGLTISFKSNGDLFEWMYYYFIRKNYFKLDFARAKMKLNNQILFQSFSDQIWGLRRHLWLVIVSEKAHSLWRHVIETVWLFGSALGGLEKLSSNCKARTPKFKLIFVSLLQSKLLKNLTSECIGENTVVQY